MGLESGELRRTLSELSSDNSLVSNQEFYKSQRKQLRFVIFCYFINNLIDIIWKIIFIENVEKDYVCNNESEIVKKSFEKLKFRY